MDLSQFSTSILIAAIVAAGLVIWFSGVKLVNVVDIIDKRFGLGQAIGGVALLAVITNLPEIAITVSASLNGRIEVAVSNILGGIAIQTVVIVFLDAYRKKTLPPITALVGARTVGVEGATVCAVLLVVIAAHFAPVGFNIKGVTPAAITIGLIWIGSLFVLRAIKPAQKAADKPLDKKEEKTTGYAIGSLILLAAVTLVAGYFLEIASDEIADRIGMSGILFSATILASMTSLPELSTGIASMRSGDYELAVSDIIGGNAFLPVLFILAQILSSNTVFGSAGYYDIYLTAVGIILTVVYMIGFARQSRGTILGLGRYSLAVILIYAAAIAYLFAAHPG